MPVGTVTVDSNFTDVGGRRGRRAFVVNTRLAHSGRFGIICSRVVLPSGKVVSFGQLAPLSGFAQLIFMFLIFGGIEILTLEPFASSGPLFTTVIVCSSCSLFPASVGPSIEIARSVVPDVDGFAKLYPEKDSIYTRILIIAKIKIFIPVRILKEIVPHVIHFLKFIGVYG